MITKLELSILAQIKPTLQEEKDLKTTTNKCVLKIKKELSAHPIKIIIGGSLAKDTNLTNNNEVDLFIAFKYLENKTKAANISSYLKKALDELQPQQKNDKNKDKNQKNKDQKNKKSDRYHNLH